MLSSAHCRNHYYREFAYKTLPGESTHELIRMKFSPIRSDLDMQKLVDTYQSRPGLYVSVYSFERLTEKGTIDYKSAKINRIYLDFDCKADPQKAIDETLLVVKSLSKRKIFCHCYFSGGKGIAMYIEFKTLLLKNEHKKDILALFFDAIKDMVKKDAGKDLTTLDGQVRGDIARVSRLPNSRHSSGLYCIPLSFGDMWKGLDHIKKLARQPREDYDLDEVILKNTMRNDVMKYVIRNIQTDMLKKKEIERAIKEGKARQFTINRRVIKNNPDRITEADISKARGTPLSSFTGHEKKIVCPFHNDSNPSLSIDHKKGLWHCFGCGKGGDVITWVMEEQHTDFKNAVRHIIGGSA